jgi:3',5'-cyclic AMP phosphodiesterase CpdA
LSAPRPELTLIQFSDTHIRPAGELMHDQIDTFAAVEKAVATVLSAGSPVHGLLLTGDLADDGRAEAYRRLHTVMRRAADTLDAQLVYAMGNHDERAAFAAELLSIPDSSGPLDSVHWINGLRIVVLDSTTPGRPEGRLEADQLRWLRAELANPAPRGSLLVVHHPPLPSPMPSAHMLRLLNADDLADALAGTDVRMILTGHAHHTGCGSLNGIPVWVSPAIAYRLDPLPPRGRLRGLAGAGITRIDLIDGNLVATAVGIDDAATVYDTDREAMVRRIVEVTSAEVTAVETTS